MKVRILFCFLAILGLVSHVSTQWRRLCKLVGRDNIELKVERNLISIEWSIFRRDCPLDTYQYYDSKVGLNQSITALPIEMKNLTAGTQYNFTLYDVRYKTEIFSMQITTKETLFAVMKRGPDVDVNGTDLIVYVNQTFTTSNQEPNLYLVQYKEASEVRWETAVRESLPLPERVVIKSLKPSTLYQVRTELLVVLDSEKNTTYRNTGLEVPYTDVYTDCVVVGQNDVQVMSGHDSITITWELNNASCLPDYYAYNMKLTGSNNTYSQNVTQLPIKLRQLEPGASYNFHLFRNKNHILTLNLDTREEPLPYLKQAPKILQCLADGFILSIDSGNVMHGSANITHLMLQYKASGDTVWNASSSFSWPVSNLTLHGLKNNTKYKIRAVLLENEISGEFGDVVPVLTSHICLESGDVTNWTQILIASATSLALVILITTVLLVMWCKKNHVFFNNEIYDYKNRTSISTSINRSYQHKVDDDDFQFEEVQGIMLNNDSGSDNE